MDKKLVAKLGVEGAGFSVYGCEDDGSWSFWIEGSSWGLDENDDEVVQTWSSDPVTDLGLIVPKDWPMYSALAIHADFMVWFRDHYESALDSLSPEMREMQANSGHRRWVEILRGDRKLNIGELRRRLDEMG